MKKIKYDKRRLRKLARRENARKRQNAAWLAVVDPPRDLKIGDIITMTNWPVARLVHKKTKEPTSLVVDVKVWLHRVSNQLRTMLGSQYVNEGHAILVRDRGNRPSYFFFPEFKRKVEVEKLPLGTAMTVVPSFEAQYRPVPPQKAQPSRQWLGSRAALRRENRNLGFFYANPNYR